MELELSNGPSNASLRIHALDYLRGILAMAVMFYHWKLINGINAGPLVNQAMEKAGSYSVCAFYVLSGMSLALVYQKRRVESAFLKEFWIKRLFRIAPLFLLVISLSLAMDLLPGLIAGKSVDLPSAKRLFLNYSLLFAWHNPADSLAMGGWSIGDELVFYSLFPVVLLVSRRSKLAASCTVSLCLVIGGYFAFFLIQPELEIVQQWSTYVNPLNHLFLFVVGMNLALWRPRFLMQKAHIPALFLSITALLLIPSGLDSHLYCGANRMFFSFLIVVICWIALEWSSAFGKPSPILTWMGWVSYGVYLLHPLCFNASLRYVAYPLHRNPIIISLLLGTAATISWIYFEKPMMNTGRAFLKSGREASCKSFSMGF